MDLWELEITCNLWPHYNYNYISSSGRASLISCPDLTHSWWRGSRMRGWGLSMRLNYSLDHIIDSTADKAMLCQSLEIVQTWFRFPASGFGLPCDETSNGTYVTCTQKWWDKFNSLLFALWALLIALMKRFMCFHSCHCHLCFYSIQNMHFWSHACQVCHPQASL